MSIACEAPWLLGCVMRALYLFSPAGTAAVGAVPASSTSCTMAAGRHRRRPTGARPPGRRPLALLLLHRVACIAAMGG